MFGATRGRGKVQFNWDPQCKCPSCEGGARSAFGALRGWLAGWLLHLQVRDLQRHHRTTSTVLLFSLVFLLRFFVFYGPGCRIGVCVYEHFCNFRYVVVPIPKFVRGNKRIIELQRMRK